MVAQFFVRKQLSTGDKLAIYLVPFTIINLTAYILYALGLVDFGILH